VFQEILLRKYIALFGGATEAIGVVTAAHVEFVVREEPDFRLI
jgi:hypothetical protein